MDWIDADLTPEFAFLREMLATSGPWARVALSSAARQSPWFAAQVAELAPPSSPGPMLAVAAGLSLALPVAGPLAAQAGEVGVAAVRQVLGHQERDGDVFDFRDGEAVWADTGKAVSRNQLRAMPAGGRQEFYASMGIVAPAEVLSDAPEPVEVAQASPERIMVCRDGRDAPVLVEIRERVAALRRQRDTAYLAAAPAATAGGTEAAGNLPTADGAAGLASAGNEGASRPDGGGATLYDRIWQEVAEERAQAKARGDLPPAALAGDPAPSAYTRVWADVAAERAGLRPASPDLVDVPTSPEIAAVPISPAVTDVPEGTGVADAPPADRDLVDASAAFLEPAG